MFILNFRDRSRCEVKLQDPNRQRVKTLKTDTNPHLEPRSELNELCQQAAGLTSMSSLQSSRLDGLGLLMRSSFRCFELRKRQVKGATTENDRLDV